MLIVLLLDDSVHMREEKHLEEYIMNETGVIYAGTYDNMFTWPWNFAQVKINSNLVQIIVVAH